MRSLLIFLGRLLSALIGSTLFALSFSFLTKSFQEPLGYLHPDSLTGTALLVIGGFILWVGLWPRAANRSARASFSKQFSYDAELQAAMDHRVVRIQYKDSAGNITNRDIEVYHPRDDSYVFGFCRLRQEPRTFLVQRILYWKDLTEQFTHNPLVEEWFDTEGKIHGSFRQDWPTWVRQKQRQSTAKPYILKRDKKNLWD